MQPLLETIALEVPLRGVRALHPAGALMTISDDREAYERGRRAGEEQARLAFAREREELQALQAGILARLECAVPKALKECESGLVRLALQIAERVIGSTPVSAEMVEANVREALSQVEDTTEVHIDVNPQDFEMLQRLNSPLLSNSDSSRQLHFHSSAEVSRGGCLVKTRFGTLDARRETKMEMMRQLLHAA